MLWHFIVSARCHLTVAMVTVIRADGVTVGDLWDFVKIGT